MISYYDRQPYRSRVYFAQLTESGPIKMGRSANVPRRLRELRAQVGAPLTLLGTIPTPWGGSEGGWHDRLAQYRIVGEWFCPEAELLAAIHEALEAEAAIEAFRIKSERYRRKNDRAAMAELRRRAGLPTGTAS